MLIRNTILQALRTELEAGEQVLAFWEAGSRATGRVDDQSDLDLMAIVADGAVEAVRERVEAALKRIAPIDLHFLVPQPSWHGHWQAFYRLEGISPFLLIDICLMERTTQNWFLEPEMHGRPAVFFDKEGLVCPQPTAAVPFAERLAKRLSLLEVSTELFHLFVDKELDRGRVIDALSFYQGMILSRLLEALRMRHCPWRYNFGMRYLNSDLPPAVYEQVCSLLYVAGPEELASKKAQALALLRKTLADLRGLDLAALLEAARRAPVPLAIRPVAPGDYEAIVAAGAAAVPRFADTAAAMRQNDTERPECIIRRFAAEMDGQVVGTVWFRELSRRHRPGRFLVNGWVHPAYQGRGVGSALFDHAITAVRSVGAQSLKLWTREDLPQAMRFLEKRGCVEMERHSYSTLDLARFDFRPYEGLEERVEAGGIRLLTLQEWQAYPDWDRRLFELHGELLADVPEPDLIPGDWEEFQQSTLGSPMLLPEAHLVALDGSELIGTSSLWKTKEPDKLYTRLTGVRQAYRHRSIALAMKLKGLRYARAHGYSRVETSNAGVNRPMLRINEQLGFVKEPGWVGFNRGVW